MGEDNQLKTPVGKSDWGHMSEEQTDEVERIISGLIESGSIIPKWYHREELLRAAFSLLRKQDSSTHVINLLAQEVELHGNLNNDGYSLMNDIADELDIL